MLDAEPVSPRLWQGSLPKAGHPLPFDVVVLCAAESQFDPRVYGHRPFGVRARVLRCPLTDGGLPLSRQGVSRAFSAAVQVAKAYAEGQKILTTCQMGWNRSGIVNALALMELGIDVSTTIEIIRRARPKALSNPHFVRLLYEAAGRALVRIPISREMRS